MMDLHCHLDLYDDPAQILEETEASGVYTLAVTNLPAAFEPLQCLAAESRRVRVAVGIHPALAHTAHADLLLFRYALQKTRYVGEIGLDGSTAHRAELPCQQRVFSEVLRACAEVGGRILSVHSRGAVGLVLESLSRQPGAGTPILHWFSGSINELAVATSAGCWFSVNLAMTASPRGRKLIACMPPARVLLETDGPYTRYRGMPARPVNTSSMLEELSKIWERSSCECLAQLEANLRELLASADRP